MNENITYDMDRIITTNQLPMSFRMFMGLAQLLVIHGIVTEYSEGIPKLDFDHNQILQERK